MFRCCHGTVRIWPDVLLLLQLQRWVSESISEAPYSFKADGVNVCSTNLVVAVALRTPGWEVRAGMKM